jgi:hypothetical protein
VDRSQAARKKSAIATTFVALLRGVNVGPAKRLAMAALQAAFEGAGGGKVETLLQSGNVVFDAPSASRGSSLTVRRPTPSSSSAPTSISDCPTASRAAS